jgi:hypothetical protein
MFIADSLFVYGGLSKTQLRNKDDKSSCFRPFCTGSAPDTRVLYGAFRINAFELAQLILCMQSARFSCSGRLETDPKNCLTPPETMNVRPHYFCLLLVFISVSVFEEFAFIGRDFT